MNIRHGDVGLISGAILPIAAKREQGPVVLAEGEVTGHAHRVRGSAVSLWDAGAQRYLVVECDDAILDHEEHGPVAIPPGTYQIVIQRVYDPLTELSRRVAD